MRALPVLAIAFACVLANTGHAQTPQTPQAVATIDSGMSRADVVAKLGAPLSSKTHGASTYLYYPNGCERTCGMQDLVVLDGDHVVDAIFRSPARQYSGRSSSPRMMSLDDAHKVALAKGDTVGAAAVPRPRKALAITQSGKPAAPKTDSAKANRPPTIAKPSAPATKTNAPATKTSATATKTSAPAPTTKANQPAPATKPTAVAVTKAKPSVHRPPPPELSMWQKIWRRITGLF